MKIIFTKEYTDKESFDNWVVVTKGSRALLVDETIGRVEISEGFDSLTTLEGVPAGSYTEDTGEAGI